MASYWARKFFREKLSSLEPDHVNRDKNLQMMVSQSKNEKDFNHPKSETIAHNPRSGWKLRNPGEGQDEAPVSYNQETVFIYSRELFS